MKKHMSAGRLHDDHIALALPSIGSRARHPYDGGETAARQVSHAMRLVLRVVVLADDFR